MGFTRGGACGEQLRQRAIEYARRECAVIDSKVCASVSHSLWRTPEAVCSSVTLMMPAKSVITGEVPAST